MTLRTWPSAGMGRYCCVKGCNAKTRKDPTLRFFHFPGKILRPALRKQWIINVNRVDENGKLWEPKKTSTVCSKHFQDGEPTIQHPIPEVNLGHAFVKKVIGRRHIMKSKVQKEKKPKKKRQAKSGEAGKRLTGTVPEFLAMCDFQSFSSMQAVTLGFFGTGPRASGLLKSAGPTRFSLAQPYCVTQHIYVQCSKFII